MKAEWLLIGALFALPLNRQQTPSNPVTARDYYNELKVAGCRSLRCQGCGFGIFLVLVAHGQPKPAPGAAAFGVKAAVCDFSLSSLRVVGPNPTKHSSFNEFVGRLGSTLPKVHQNKRLQLSL